MVSPTSTDAVSNPPNMRRSFAAAIECVSETGRALAPFEPTVPDIAAERTPDGLAIADIIWWRDDRAGEATEGGIHATRNRSSRPGGP